MSKVPSPPPDPKGQESDTDTDLDMPKLEKVRASSYNSLAQAATQNHMFFVSVFLWIYFSKSFTIYQL
jgi:hypothetical protein